MLLHYFLELGGPQCYELPGSIKLAADQSTVKHYLCQQQSRFAKSQHNTYSLCAAPQAFRGDICSLPASFNRRGRCRR